MKLFCLGLLTSGSLAVIIFVALIQVGFISRPLEAVTEAASTESSVASAEEVVDSASVEYSHEGCLQGAFVVPYPDGSMFRTQEVYLCGDDMKYTNNPEDAQIYNVPQDFN